jgi:hypothetical protein
MHDKIIPHQALLTYNDIANDDVVFVNMSLENPVGGKLQKIVYYQTKMIVWRKVPKYFHSADGYNLFHL